MILFACNDQQPDQPDTPEVSNYLEITNGTIINLYDAFGEDIQGLKKDFGFSCIIRYNDQTILFDAGSNADVFRQNVETMGVDLKSVDMVIASHAHFDHINGFDHLLEVNPDVTIYFPFDPFWGSDFPFDLSGQDNTITDSLEKRMQYFHGDYHDFSFNQTGRFWNANIEFIREDTEIAPGINLIATSSPYMGYFSRYPNIGMDSVMTRNNIAGGSEKFIELQELSLSLDTEEGELLVVGCSHSTVETIISSARNFTGREISMLYGGYHLLPYDRATLETLAVRLKEEHDVKKLLRLIAPVTLLSRYCRTRLARTMYLPDLEAL